MSVKDKKPIAVCGTTNTMALAMYEIEDGIECRVATAFIMSDKPLRITWSKVQYDKFNEGYIHKGGTKYYLHDFMQIETK